MAFIYVKIFDILVISIQPNPVTERVNRVVLECGKSCNAAIWAAKTMQFIP